MVKAQKVKALRTPDEARDPGLVGMQAQPERCQDRGDQLAGPDGLLAGRTQDDEVVRVAHQHSQPSPCVRPCLIEDVQGDVAQQRRDRRALRRARLGGGHDPALEDPRSQPTPQQLEHPPVRHAPLELSDQRRLRDLVKTAVDVGVKRPHLATVDGRPDRLQRVMRRPPGPEPVAGRQKVGFKDRLKHDLRRRHHHAIGDAGDAERPQLTAAARLGDMDAAQRPRPVGPGPQRARESVEELIDSGTLDRLDGHAVDAGRPPVGTDLTPRPAHDVAAGDLVIQGMKTAIPILLGTAVEHALESPNPVHAQGATDGPSLKIGTHRGSSRLPVHR